MAKVNKVNVASFMPILRCMFIHKLLDQRHDSYYNICKFTCFRNNFLSQPTLSQHFNIYVNMLTASYFHEKIRVRSLIQCV